MNNDFVETWHYGLRKNIKQVKKILRNKKFSNFNFLWDFVFFSTWQHMPLLSFWNFFNLTTTHFKISAWTILYTLRGPHYHVFAWSTSSQSITWRLANSATFLHGHHLVKCNVTLLTKSITTKSSHKYECGSKTYLHIWKWDKKIKNDKSVNFKIHETTKVRISGLRSCQVIS